MKSKVTGDVTLENWQEDRAYGLKNLEKIVRDLFLVNAEAIRPLKISKDESILDLPAVKSLVDHPDFDAMVILHEDQIISEEYRNGMDVTSLHSAQSSSKTTINLLVGKAVADGKLDLDTKVEEYISEIGEGYRGRTVRDVLSMNVMHELDETAAYTAKDRSFFDKDEASFGWLPSKITEKNRREFIASLKAGNEDGSNENRTGKYFYATANTDVAGWIVERATGVPLQEAIRGVMHAIGGENSVYFGTDRVGIPNVGAGFVMTTRDFARYGMLLGSGGEGISGEKVGGGMDWVKKTMEDGEVSMGHDGWFYNYSAYTSKWGIGHAGWGGQWIWADPESKTVIAIFSGLSGDDPADPEYAAKLIDIAVEVVDHQRGK